MKTYLNMCFANNSNLEVLKQNGNDKHATCFVEKCICPRSED